jgi:hypothetical protein
VYGRGMGDWFDPGCQPGTHGCVPHWYCYIPGAVTPDCLSSLAVGTGELASAAGGAVGSVVSSAATGATGGLFSGLLGGSNCDPSDWWCQYGMWVLLGAAVVGVAIYAAPRGRR